MEPIPTLAQAAQPVVEQHLQQDPDELYAELGKRLHAMQQAPAASASFAPVPAVTDIPLDALRTSGEKFFQRVSAQAYSLICGSDDQGNTQREQLLEALGSGSAGVGGLLVTFLVANLGLAPAVAGIVAALLIKLVFAPAFASACEAWKAMLDQANPPAAAPSPSTPAPSPAG